MNRIFGIKCGRPHLMLETGAPGSVGDLRSVLPPVQWFSRTLRGISGNGCRRPPGLRSILLRVLVPASALSFKTRAATTQSAGEPHPNLASLTKLQTQTPGTRLRSLKQRKSHGRGVEGHPRQGAYCGGQLMTWLKAASQKSQTCMLPLSVVSTPGRVNTLFEPLLNSPGGCNSFFHLNIENLALYFPTQRKRKAGVG